MDQINDIKFSINKKCYYYCDEISPIKSNNNWMSKIDDNTLLSQMSIPGSHDSCSRYGSIFSQSQSYSIFDQLKSGIRVLDIRCKIHKDILTIYHGLFYQNINFGEIIIQIETFLKENPSEGVLIKIAEECSPQDPTDSFENILLKYINAFSELFLLQKNIPIMKQLRGKIWLMINTNININTINYNDLQHHNGKRKEWYRSINDHKSNILSHLEKANNSSNSEICFTDCSSEGMCLQAPYLIAIQSNYVIMNTEKPKKVGIVLMDFPGEEVIKFIIDLNH